MTNDTNKVIWQIDKLRSWEKNPRGIRTADFERLKNQIQMLGEDLIPAHQYKPLLITPDGEVLGGNMRLKAYQDLGFTDIWVSIVNPKSEAEKLEYALSDNDRAGYYEDDKLQQLINEYKDDIDLDLYKVDLASNLDLQSVINQISPDTSEAGQGEQEVDENTYSLDHKCPKCGFEFK